MDKIIADFRRAYNHEPIRYAVVTVICAAALFFTGMYTRKTLNIAAFVVTGFLAANLLWAAIDIYLIAPAAFKKRLSAMPENDRNEVLNEYASAVKLGNHILYKKRWLMAFSKRRIVVMEFEEITAARLKNGRLELISQSGEKAVLEVGTPENAALCAAALRAQNDKIKVVK